LTALAGNAEFARELAAHFIASGRHSLEMAAKAGNADQLAGLTQHLRSEFEIAADSLQSKVE
jgi:hypothetical protein